MSKKTSFLFFFSLLLFQARAQQRAPEDTFPRYKWEVGTDLLFLVNRNTVPPSLFFRLNRDDFTALRFRIGGNYTEHTNPPFIPDNVNATDLQKTALTSFISVGWEWQRQHGRFQAFYGSDIFSEYRLDRNEYAIVGGKDFFPKFRYLTLGVSPLVGAKYLIHPRLSVSAESHLNIAYYSDTIHSFRLTPSENTLGVEEKVKRKYLKIGYSPVYVFNLIYHF